MVYFSPQNNTDETFSVQAAGARPVIVTYNGSGLHQFTGPVPMVDISHSVNRNGAGLIEGHTTRIDLSGKIVRTGVDGDVLPSGSGIGPVLESIKKLKEFLSKNDNGVLAITCGVTNTIFSATGVRLVDFTANKSEDNWLYTADYSMSFEYYEPSGITGGYYVKSTSDSWSIEAVEDNVYANMSLASKTKGETHNPQLKPTAPSPTSQVPGGYGGSGPIGGNNLSVINMPQYRISHRVSAVGMPSGTGSSVMYQAYTEAKKWVQDRLSSAFSQPSISGLAYLVSNPSETPSTFNGGIYLYNHVRSTNFSITEGNYEINDTWLAMPSGIGYLEDYSIESSTDDRNIKTVRVQGQIKGLNIATISLMSGNSSYTNPSGSGKLHLTEYNQLMSGSLSHQIPDNISQSSTASNLSQSKYDNALSGWLYDIKPYLYRRAGLVIGSADRSGDYINVTSVMTAPNNPIYCNERFLNPNPVSTTEGHDPRKGTISYSVEYNNKLVLISGVMSENISINTTGPADVFSESFIIGRRLGPILQSLNARTATRKDVSVDITIVPPSSIGAIQMTNSGCPLFTGGYIYKTIDDLINGLKPYGSQQTAVFGSIGVGRQQMQGQVFTTQDNHNWNPAEGRYSRNVSWVYQPCNNTQSYMDN